MRMVYRACVTNLKVGGGGGQGQQKKRAKAFSPFTAALKLLAS